MQLEYFHLRPNQTPPHIPSRPFIAILIADTVVDEAWRILVSNWLVESGCLHLVAWGIDCEIWHDCVDRADMELFDLVNNPDAHLVMTTWHPNEPLSEAFWFVHNCAFHPDTELDETIIVHVADKDRRSQMLKAYHDGMDLHASD